MATDERVSSFISALEDEDEKLAKQLKKLKDDGESHLSDVIARFDRKRAGTLDDGDRALATRVLNLLHRPNPTGLEHLSNILSYMGCGTDAVLDHQEVTLATEVLELFCKADSENDTLSNKELEVLLAVLSALDDDGNGVIDVKERRALRDELWDPAAFLANQKENNPLVRDVLGLK